MSRWEGVLVLAALTVVTGGWALAYWLLFRLIAGLDGWIVHREMTPARAACLERCRRRRERRECAGFARSVKG